MISPRLNNRMALLLLCYSWLWCGIVFLSLSMTGVFPWVWLAARFADSDGLSAAYVNLIRTSQWSLSLALLAGGAGMEFLPFATKGVRRKWMGAAPVRLSLLIALAGLSGAWFVQAVLFDNIPHITDATSHWFQARIFAAGHLSAAPPPCPNAFFQHNVIMGSGGQWHTKYFPGHALWLVWPLRTLAMPLAFALFLASAHRIVARFFDRFVAHATTGLLAFSPLMLLLSASFMSHMTLLMWMAMGWAFLLAAPDSPRMSAGFGAAAAAGFCGGMGVLTRPQDAILFGVFALCITLPRLRQLKSRPAMIASGLLFGAAFPLLFLLFWNWTLYGHVWASGYNFSGAAPASQTPIIHDTLGFSDGFTGTRALMQSFWVGLRLNQALLGWPAALPLLLPALALPSVRRKNWILLLGAGWLYLPYFFFHYYGFELEARYCAAPAPLLVLMIARTLVASFRTLPPAGAGRRALAAWIAAFVFYAGAYYWPVYLFPRYSKSYEETSPDIHRAALTAELKTPALLLLPADGFVYSSGFIHNDPELRAPILYARDLPGERACLRKAFPDRRLYRFIPDTVDPFCGTFKPVESTP